MRFMVDKHFLIALAAGPVCWLALVAAGLPQPAGLPAANVLLYGIVLYPPLEEFVFRGGLQTFLLQRPKLIRRVAGVSGANILTSVVFAAMHLLSHTPAWAAAVFIPSLVFGHLRERFGHVVPSAIVHAIYNAGFLLLFA